MHARLLSICGALVMGVAAAACAKGSTGPGLGGSGAEGASGPTSSSSSTSSASGSSSSTSASSSSSSSGSTSTSSSSSSSSGSSCPTPCKVTNPQCGCSGGEVCTVEAGIVTCGQAGSDAVGQACGTSTTDLCQGGAACVTASSTVGQCLEFCDTDGDCASLGGICVITLDDGTGNSIPGITLCSPGCNPIGGAGCPSTSSCELGREQSGLQRWFGLCGPSGTNTQGAPCNATMNDCAPGYTCIDPDGTSGSLPDECLRYCDADNIASCPGGLTCYALQDQSTQPIVLNGVTMGVCF